MQLNEALVILNENDLVAEPLRIDEGFDTVLEYIETGLAVLFSPYLRIVAMILGENEEDALTENLERLEYGIIKKIMSSKILKAIFSKIVSNDELRNKVKNKLLEIIEYRYGYIDTKDKVLDVLNQTLQNIANNLEKNKNLLNKI